MRFRNINAFLDVVLDAANPSNRVVLAYVCLVGDDVHQSDYLVDFQLAGIRSFLNLIVEGRRQRLRADEKLVESLFDCAVTEGLVRALEVMQELAHIYLPTGRLKTFDATLGLIANAGVEVWPLEKADVVLARQLHEQHPTLQARDLCHLAGCRRRGIREIKTFDQTLAALSGNPSVQ